jgi:undecaprenyl-diphosphatase
VNLGAMFASIGGPDELLFRALNLAGANPTLDAIMILITTLGGTYIVALFAVPLWLRGQREATFDFILIFVITMFVTTAIKYLVDRSRPCVDVTFGARTLPGYGCVTEPDPSLPSGHASRAFALAGLVFFRFRWRAGSPAIVFASLVGLSRVYLGLHWPSDILAGAIVGLGIAALVELVSRRVVVYQRIRKWIVELIPHWPRRKPV